MAFFKSGKDGTQTASMKDTINTATIITKGTTIVGDMVGSDSIHIDGEIKGSIKVNNLVVIGKSGSVNGNIEAQNIISSGMIDGSVKCDELEVLELSTVKKTINARKVLVIGKVQGDMVCEDLIIEQKGLVEDRIQAKNVTVSGSLIGEVACELLSTKQTGYVKGSMFVNNISNEGGKVEGSIGQYKELISEKKDENIKKETQQNSEKATSKSNLDIEKKK